MYLLLCDIGYYNTYFLFCQIFILKIISYHFQNIIPLGFIAYSKLGQPRNSRPERTISLVNLSGAPLAQVESSPYADLGARALPSVLVGVRD